MALDRRPQALALVARIFEPHMARVMPLEPLRRAEVRRPAVLL